MVVVPEAQATKTGRLSWPRRFRRLSLGNLFIFGIRCDGERANKSIGRGGLGERDLEKEEREGKELGRLRPQGPGGGF